MCVSSAGKSYSFKDAKSTNKNVEMKSALYLKKQTKKKTTYCTFNSNDLT